MEGKNVKAVGGIHRALGRRLEDAGFGCAAKLSCKVKKMTKRKFMRYMLKTAGGNVRHAMDSYVSMTNHCRKVKDCKLDGKSVRAVGGINGALGRRLKKAGFDTAAKLSCETAGGNVRHAMDSYVSVTNHCRKVKDCKCGGRR
ncbi:hypothetical protein NP493_1087g00025 [Ridgeia piscesae]|uniref:Uncharacterized protein n=1 Tax=Ridgeia piscesae TaxID=27915 RepID=A0AAD9NIF9_RIDPI|nr:hypothetical protein NP493_1087g00025 [Ridgeia piscesae]